MVEIPGTELGKQKRTISSFIFDDNEVLKERTFSICRINDNLVAYGIFLPKVVPLKDNKGREIGETQKWKPVLIDSECNLIEANKGLETKYKVKVETPFNLTLRWTLGSIKNYIDGNAGQVDGKELFDLIRGRYSEFMYFRTEPWYDVHSLWDIGTYFFELFHVFPIMEMRGLPGTAKTKCMKVSQRMTLNPTGIMINPSEASLFRETHDKRPTKYIDEAEKLFVWNSRTKNIETDLRAELINSSYSKCSVVTRVEKIGNRYVIFPYKTYSPTMIGSIRGLYGATEDRAITHIMTKAPDADERGEMEIEDQENDPVWAEIRDKLYLFGLQNWKIIEKEYREFDEDTGIKKRDLQLWKPLLVLAKIIDKDVYDRVVKFAKEMSKIRKLDFITEGSPDYIILKELQKLVKDVKDPEIRTYLKDIHEKVKFELSEMKAKTLSSRLDNLGFKELRGKDREGSFFTITGEIFETVISPIAPKLTETEEIENEK